MLNIGRIILAERILAEPDRNNKHNRGRHHAKRRRSQSVNKKLHVPQLTTFRREINPRVDAMLRASWLG